MAYVLDIAVILIVVATVFAGYRHGFLKSVIGVVGLLASLLLAFFVSGMVADWVYTGIIQPKTEEAIATGIEESIGTAASVEEGLQVAVEYIPGVVRNFMEDEGLSSESLAQQVDQTTGDTAKAVAVTVTDKVVRPVMILVVRSVSFLILFVVLLIVTGLLGKLLGGILKHTPLKGLNSLLGALLGLLKSVMWVLFLVTLVQMIAHFSSDSAFISQKTIEDTTLVEAIADINPLVTTRDALMSQLNDLF